MARTRAISSHPTSSQMNRRMQPKRKARQNKGARSAVKSEPIKRPRIQLKQQIQPRSVGTSCSSSRPAQLRENCESSLANMADNKHSWSIEEEKFLGECFKDPKRAQDYNTCKVLFYGPVADLMNDRWASKPGYVPVNARKVRSKVESKLASWMEHRTSSIETGTSPNFVPNINSVFSDAATSSYSKGVSKRRKKKYTDPCDLDTSVKYMHEHGCTSVEYFSYTMALEHPTVLRGFLNMTSFQQREKFLTDMAKILAGKTTSCELAKTPPGDL